VYFSGVFVQEGIVQEVEPGGHCAYGGMHGLSPPWKKRGLAWRQIVSGSILIAPHEHATKPFPSARIIFVAPS
jgi:hypothetical protein